MERQPHTPEQSERTDPRIEEALGILDAGLDRVMSKEGFKQFLEAKPTSRNSLPRISSSVWAQNPTP